MVNVLKWTESGNARAFKRAKETPKLHPCFLCLDYSSNSCFFHELQLTLEVMIIFRCFPLFLGYALDVEINLKHYSSWLHTKVYPLSGGGALYYSAVTPPFSCNRVGSRRKSRKFFWLQRSYTKESNVLQDTQVLKLRNVLSPLTTESQKACKEVG